MRKIALISHSFFVLTAAVSGCGKSSSKNDATAAAVEATQDAQYSELSGTWAKDCAKAAAGGVPGSVIEAQIFTKAHVLNVITSYFDNDCTQVRARIIFTAGYQTSGLLAGSQIRKIDYTSLAVAGASGDQSASLTWLNTNKFCGFSDWRAGIAKALTGLDCVASFVSGAAINSGDKNYNVYQISDGKLQNGLLDAKTATGKSDSARPLNVDPSASFTKQKGTDELVNQLEVLLTPVKAGTPIVAATQTTNASKVTLVVPELPDTTTDALTFLRFDLNPPNPFLSILTTQADSLKTSTIDQVPPGTYAVTVSQIANSNRNTVLKTGTAQLTVQPNTPKSITINIK